MFSCPRFLPFFASLLVLSACGIVGQEPVQVTGESDCRPSTRGSAWCGRINANVGTGNACLSWTCNQSSGQCERHDRDDDGDGISPAACVANASDPIDCDDLDPNSKPQAQEVDAQGNFLCDGRDNDCDGKVDEGVYELKAVAIASSQPVPSDALLRADVDYLEARNGEFSLWASSGRSVWIVRPDGSSVMGTAASSEALSYGPPSLFLGQGIEEGVVVTSDGEPISRASFYRWESDTTVSLHEDVKAVGYQSLDSGHFRLAFAEDTRGIAGLIVEQRRTGMQRSICTPSSRGSIRLTATFIGADGSIASADVGVFKGTEAAAFARDREVPNFLPVHKTDGSLVWLGIVEKSLTELSLIEAHVENATANRAGNVVVRTLLDFPIGTSGDSNTWSPNDIQIVQLPEAGGKARFVLAYRNGPCEQSNGIELVNFDYDLGTASSSLGMRISNLAGSDKPSGVGISYTPQTEEIHVAWLDGPSAALHLVRLKNSTPVAQGSYQTILGNGTAASVRGAIGAHFERDGSPFGMFAWEQNETVSISNYSLQCRAAQPASDAGSVDAGAQADSRTDSSLDAN